MTIELTKEEVEVIITSIRASFFHGLKAAIATNLVYKLERIKEK